MNRLNFKLSELKKESEAALSRAKSKHAAWNTKALKAVENEEDPLTPGPVARKALFDAQTLAIPGLAEEIKYLEAMNKQALELEELYQNKPALLSQESFAGDRGADASIRMRWSQELAILPASVVTVLGELAKREADLPMIYTVWLSGLNGREGVPKFDLKDVIVPGQLQGLSDCMNIKCNLAEAHLLFKEVVRVKAAANDAHALELLSLGRIRAEAADMQSQARLAS